MSKTKNLGDAGLIAGARVWITPKPELVGPGGLWAAWWPKDPRAAIGTVTRVQKNGRVLVACSFLPNGTKRAGDDGVKSLLFSATDLWVIL